MQSEARYRASLTVSVSVSVTVDVSNVCVDVVVDVVVIIAGGVVILYVILDGVFLFVRPGLCSRYGLGHGNRSARGDGRHTVIDSSQPSSAESSKECIADLRSSA